MAKTRVIYPGTFDPITFGHCDLIKRASVLFDEVIVAIAVNPLKSPHFSVEERTRLAKAATDEMCGVVVENFDCLLTEFASQKNTSVIIRGLRALTDFEYEIQLANMNRQLKKDLDTLFLTPDEAYANISSSLVREIAHYGGDVSRFVPPAVVEALHK